MRTCSCCLLFLFHLFTSPRLLAPRAKSTRAPFLSTPPHHVLDKSLHLSKTYTITRFTTFTVQLSNPHQPVICWADVMSAAATAIAASLVRTAKECCESSESAACRRHPPPGYERCAGGFDVLPGHVHPWHLPAMPSQEAFHQTGTRPVIVTANPMVKSQVSCDVRRDHGG